MSMSTRWLKSLASGRTYVEPSPVGSLAMATRSVIGRLGRVILLAAGERLLPPSKRKFGGGI